jgi:hypothetical protein
MNAHEFKCVTAEIRRASKRLDALANDHADLAREFQRIARLVRIAHQTGSGASDYLAALADAAGRLTTNEVESLALVGELLALYFSPTQHG